MLPGPVRAVKKEIPLKNSVDNNVCVVNATNLKVVVRLRPPNEREISSGKVNLIKVVDNHMLMFDPKPQEDEWNNPSKSRLGSDRKMKDLLFAFDRVFDGNSTNEEVFEDTTKSVIQSVLKGYNCSVFAYGATSAGKTHTMLGSAEEPGVIFLTMMELYKELMHKKDKYDSDISVSYLEIYNETCKDLLLPKGSLAVREDPDKGVCVNGLSLHKPKSPEELLEMLHYGNQNRSQHPTDANKQSSRSHAVFQVFVRQTEKVPDLNTNVTFAKMSLIDLAGSERATVTTNQGDRLREGANINKSLLALGNCINALAENKSKLHIPYRDSKLTRLLKDSLGGNCATIMIAAVSPSVLSYEDTYNTLKYADRAKRIKASLTANSSIVDCHISQYTKIVEELKSKLNEVTLELGKYKTTGNESGLLAKQTGEDESNKSNISVSNETKLGMKQEGNRKSQLNKVTDQLLENLQGYEKELHSLYKERCTLQQNLVVCESSGKELSLKLLQRERNFKRFEYISEIAGSIPQRAQEKLDKYRLSYESKQAHYMKQKIMLTTSLDENMKNLSDLQKKINDWASKTDSFILTHLNMVYDFKQLELKYVSLKAQCKYLRKQIPLQETENRNNEQLITHLLQIIASQQRKLNIQMSTTFTPSRFEDTNDDVKDLANQLVDGTKIAWADQTFTLDGCNDMSTAPLDVSPFKTPSKKPYVLRQIISESRRTSEETYRNTLLNAARSTMPSETPLKLNVAVKNVNIPISDVSDSCKTDLNGTFVKSSVDATTPFRVNSDLRLEDIDNELDTLKGSSIPIKTPLKMNNVLNIPRRKSSHRRSMSDGQNILTFAKSKAKSFSKIISPRNISRPSMKSSSSYSNINKKIPGPVRVTTSRVSYKENIEPKGRVVKSMKKFKSESTLPVYKQRTFRY